VGYGYFVGRTIVDEKKGVPGQNPVKIEEV